MRWMLFAVISLAVVGVAFAEDWTTTDGKTYKNVKVVKVEDDAVTILDEDGGALVPLSTLPPALQQKFHYDPVKAAAAAAQRQSEDDASTQAVATQEAQEKAQEADREKKLQAAMTAAQSGSTTPAPAPSSSSSSISSSPPPSSSTTPSRPSTSGGGGSNESSASANGGQFSLNNKGLVDVTQDTAHQQVNPNWKLVWSDEFDGPDIDKSKWNFNIDGKGEGNGELEYYSDSSKNAHIEDGMLHITAIKGDDGHKFTSVRMDTKGKFYWKYGRFEARIKMPQGKGCWPAFWLMPEDSKYGGWASSGELDIVEMVGGQMKEGDGDSINWGTIHYGDKWPHNVHTGDHIVASDKLSADFHTYAVEWEPGIIRWYFDGNLYEEQVKWYTKAAPFPAPFDQNFYVILNFAVGGAWPGKPDDSTTFPQDMVIDYVRVYQPPEWSAASN